MINKRLLASFFIGTVLSFSLSACSLTLQSESITEDDSISYTAFDNRATSTDEILQLLINSMEQNKGTCELFVTDVQLIDADLWVERLDGVEKIQCQYRRVKDGYNVVVDYDCWDDYAITYAFRNNNTSMLNERQLELYNVYSNIISTVTSRNNSDYENELAIHDYLVDNITYVKSGSTVFNAYDALIHGKAVCSGYAECFKTLMNMLGIENATISGIAGGDQHIWNAVKLDGQWYQVDVTWDDPIDSQLDTIDHSYFNITDDDMSRDHEWDRNIFKEYSSTSTEYSYVNASDVKVINNQSELNVYLTDRIRCREADVEFASTCDINIKEAASRAGEQLTYVYKTSERSEYTLYYIKFTYQ
ncbi:MAG: transglutaminase domain-containing protein [Lachnospira sp.]